MRCAQIDEGVVVQIMIVADDHQPTGDQVILPTDSGVSVGDAYAGGAFTSYVPPAVTGPTVEERIAALEAALAAARAEQ